MYEEKVVFFIKRTISHIHAVQKNAEFLIVNFADFLQLDKEECRRFLWNVMMHDQSKFSAPQFDAYVELTDFFRKKEYNKTHEYPSEKIRNDVNLAIQNHYEVENHHPEKYKGLWGKFEKIEAYEMACDLQARATELGQKNCREYYEKTWLKKHMYDVPDDANWEVVKGCMDRAIKCLKTNE